MQATPGPTSSPRQSVAPQAAASSPEPEQEPKEQEYPDPPKNRDSAPFSVLSALFDKLQNERKPERRRKMLDVWFTVSVVVSLK